MDLDTLNRLLNAVANGQTTVNDAMDKLRHISIEDIEHAHIDHHRSIRHGFPEVIFGQGKTVDQISSILQKIMAHEKVALVTRLEKDKAEHVLQQVPDTTYHEDARMLVCQKGEIKQTGKGNILIVSAGTSDIPVAREAYLTAEAMGNPVEAVFDVGVAGIHRLFQHKDKIEQASVLIVVAGMEGALPSVVAGMVSRPVIAVPTSIGYGVSFGGLTALFSMLNSCSSNVAVVNIDNGFGAGYMASMINRL